MSTYPQTIKSLLERRLVWLELHNYAPDTIQNEEGKITKFVHWSEQRGLTDPAQVTGDLLTTYQRWLAHQKGSDGVPWSPRYQYSLFYAVQHWMQWAAQVGLLLQDPTIRLEPLRLPKRLPIEVLTLEELEALTQLPHCNNASSLRDKALLEILFASALRRKEVLKLEVDDIDFKRRFLLIRLGKGQKDRYVPISRRALDWIEKYLNQARPALLAKGKSESSSLFISRLGNPLSTSGLKERLRCYLDQITPNKKGSSHLIRRSVATMLLERGCDIRTIQEFLGHRFLSTTQLYTKIRPTQLKAVYQRCHPGAASPGTNTNYQNRR